jgi:AcrR family transcriptional regulator
VRTRRQKLAAATNLIAFCTPERFAVLTADDIARHSGLAVEVCEQMLAEAKRRRGL